MRNRGKRYLTAGITAFMVLGRLVSGVHWLTDIVGAVFLSAGLYLLYCASVAMLDESGK